MTSEFFVTYNDNLYKIVVPENAVVRELKLEIKAKTGVELKYQNIQPADLLNDEGSDELPILVAGLIPGETLLLFNTGPPPRAASPPRKQEPPKVVRIQEPPKIIPPKVEPPKVASPRDRIEEPPEGEIPESVYETVNLDDNISISPRSPRGKNQPGKGAQPKQLKRMDLGPILRTPKIKPYSIDPYAFKSLLASQPSMDEDEWTAYFESKFNAVFHPQFVAKPIDDVLEACRLEKKLLLILLYNDTDIPTRDLCGTCLTREELSVYTDENQIPMWVTKVDAAFSRKFQDSLKVHLVYPFVALVGFQHNRLHIYDFITDLLQVTEFINILKKHLDSHHLYLKEEKTKEWERQQRSILTQEQNVAYEKSLVEDKERQKQKIAEQEHRATQQSIITSARQDAIYKISQLPPEPNQPPLIRVAVRLLDGSRIERKFSPNHTLQMVFDFVGGTIAQKMTDENFLSSISPPLGGNNEVIPWSISAFDLLLNYPKRTLPYSDASKTFQELGLKDSLMCFLTPRE